jgi:hypothetical protein
MSWYALRYAVGLLEGLLLAFLEVWSELFKKRLDKMSLVK